MKFSESWLREFIDTRLDARGIGERLTMAGLELDGMAPAAPPFHGVVVARIAAIAPHPDADRLRVCQVDDGSGELLQVVCGAPNARAGLVTALALVGAELPGGMRIRRAKLRGVASAGMLCSAAELGLAESAEGIMELPDDAPVGEDLRRYLDLDDMVLEVDLTPNRADCLSVRGIARELGVLTAEPVCLEDPPAVAAQSDERWPVQVAAPADCPRYVSRVIRGIDPAARTPLWMQERLRRCGVRPLHPVVDVTNYVLLEMGQPMHAFDAARLAERLEVRRARDGERLVLLDGKEITLDGDTLVIADAEGPVALAGIMGGQDSAVGEDTRDIVLESAFFRPEVIAGKARAYGLHTESSHRFERGVDFALQARAMERATELIRSLCGGEPGPVVAQVAAEQLPELPWITLRRARIGRLLGIDLPDDEVARILRGLGCQVEAGEHGWRVRPPSYRFDLRLEADLIEELARIHGYQHIPAESRAWEATIRPRPEARVDARRLRCRLNELGYQEVITFSFVSQALQTRLDPQREPLALLNPISADMGVMRTTLWAGLLGVVGHNQRRQQPDQRLFEQGLVFLPGGQAAQTRQVEHLAGAITGQAAPAQWAQPARAVDFFDLKGDVEALLALTGRPEAFRFEPAEHPALHPGQTARLLRDGRPVGWLGALHPAVQEALDLEQPVFLFELERAALEQGRVPHFTPLSKFPAVRRDLALVVDENVSWAEISQAITELGEDRIRDFQVFDVYTGKGVASGRKSLALSLILQDFSRTLEDEQVEGVIARVLEALQSRVGASLRA